MGDPFVMNAVIPDIGDLRTSLFREASQRVYGDSLSVVVVLHEANVDKAQYGRLGKLLVEASSW